MKSDSVAGIMKVWTMSCFLVFCLTGVFAEKAALTYTVTEPWKASVFGDIGGLDKITAENFEITEKGGGTVVLRSANDRGKIASTSEGIAFYYREVPAGADFELSAVASVGSFAKNNQVSFGIMVRDKVYDNEFVKTELGSYLAVGPIQTTAVPAQFTFRRTADGLSRGGDIVKSAPPGPGTSYKISFKKSGDIYVLSFGDEEPVVVADFTAFVGDIRYVGLYTSRNTAVTFTGVKLSIETRTLADLEVDYSRMKTRYRIGEILDPSGLRVRAKFDSGSVEDLVAGEYTLFGFDSANAGDYNIMVSYRGMLKTVPYTIAPLTCTALSVFSYPLKTAYYTGDTFDATGIRVIADYDNGYRSAELRSDQYELLIEGETASEYVFSSPGEETVMVRSVETPSTTLPFTVDVSPAKIVGISLGRLPSQTEYFIGENPNLAGMTVYASYDDGSRVRLSAWDYALSPFDSSTAGRKPLVLSYKGVKTTLSVSVFERQQIGLTIDTLPKTTYATGEAWDPRGLVVSVAYDNGDRDVLPASAYAVDVKSVDFSKPGLYRVFVRPAKGGLDPVAVPVAVRAPRVYEWNSIRFGQSTSDAANYVQKAADGSVKLVALEGGGKVATDHDGITFYYVVLDADEDNFELSADIEVLAYAKDPHDGQESFGIMARDVIGKAGDSGIFASNIAAAGGFSGGTKNANGTQLFVRTGIASPDGAGSEGIRRVMIEYEKPGPENTSPRQPYRLALYRTNSGFSARLNDSEPVVFWEPDILSVQDKKIYLGFYAARLATIVVKNVSLSISDRAADAPGVLPPPAKTVPALEILSLPASSSVDYKLIARTNVAGSITVKKGKEVLVRDKEIVPGMEITVPASLVPSGLTSFAAAVVPDDRQYLTSYETLIKSFAVEMRTYVPDGDIRVSPTGLPTGKGTSDDPLDLDTAVAFVRAGQRIVLEGGRYDRYAPLIIPKHNDGSPEAPKTLVAAPGTKPIVGFSKRTEGGILSGDYWIVEGIDFAYTAANTKGFTVGGNHNVIQSCRFYENGDTGCQISRTDVLEYDKTKWPSYNLIADCESYENRDPSENNADGFAAKLTSGVGNVFRRCVSHHNIDDGWDLYTKAGTGAIGAVTLENCIAYANGKSLKGVTGKGDKNGFKLGGEGVAVPHVVRDCLSFKNGSTGFSANSNPAVKIESAYSYDNAAANFALTTYAGTTPAFSIGKVFSFKTASGVRDSYPAALAGDAAFFFDGSRARNAAGQDLTLEAFTEALKTAGFAPEILKRN